MRPLSPLPAATDPVMIDGTTEPGFPGRPVVTLDGSHESTGGDGLVLLGGQSTVRGLVITNFGGYGVVLSQGGGDTVEGNYIGVDITGEKVAAEPGRGHPDPWCLQQHHRGRRRWRGERRLGQRWRRGADRG